jgi:hypothetical protein
MKPMTKEEIKSLFASLQDAPHAVVRGATEAMDRQLQQ